MAPPAVSARPFTVHARARVPARLDGKRGQSLAEFALVFPLFVVLLMFLIEYAFAFNAQLGVNFASQNGGLVASEAGNMTGADCLVLQGIENDLQPPIDKGSIIDVQVERTNPSGTVVYARNTYLRTGSRTCNLSDGRTVTVPYTTATNGYPEGQRCNVLPPYGCPQMTPARTTVDTIGVQIRYNYQWVTPLGSLMPFIGETSPTGTGYNFRKRNVFRMEPVL